MSLFAELKRRKVFKVAAGYAVVGWLVIEVAATIAPQLNFPEWVPRLITFAILLGFPVALVMAWLFDVTPEGIKVDASKAGSKRVFTVAAVMAALALGWYLHERPVSTVTTVTTPENAPLVEAAGAAPAASNVDPRSIAVLPFVNMSGDKDNEYFSDGISEELLNVLVRVKGFSVASRTSSFAFKGRDTGAAEIAEELKVKYVLEGSVRKQGDQVRITAQLIDGTDDRHLWSETYDRKLADIFQIQSDIANAIVAAVGKAMGASEKAAEVTVKADTANLGAYDSYLKARELFIARKDPKESIRLYKQAVDLDPEFARGWEGLAAAYAVAPGWIGNGEEYYPLAKEAAARALELDPKLSMPWAAIGSAEQGTLPIDWATNLSRFDRAIAADPNNATAYLWRAIAWINLGFFERALLDLKHCTSIDPAYQICRRWTAVAYLVAGDEKRALALFESGVAAGFVNGMVHLFVAPLFRNGERVAARLMLDKRGASPAFAEAWFSATDLASPAHLTPDEIKRLFIAKQGIELDSTSAYEFLYLPFGAFDAVGTMSDLDANDLEAWNPVRPDFRNSNGFKKVLSRLGVTDYWRKHGYPPQCRAVGASDFTCDAPKLKAVR
jgi:TolB-like protein